MVEIGRPGAAGVGAAGAGQPAADAHLTHLRAVNPNLDAMIKANPGIGVLLSQHAARGAVYEGKPGKGEADTTVRWTIWNHSEATSRGQNGYPAYNHGMKDDTILNKDVVIVWQKPEGGKNTKLSLGRFTGPGEIIGVYQLKDLVNGGTSRWGDGGFSGNMNVKGHGTPGKTGTMAWAVVGIDPSGRVMGGGFPASKGGDVYAYQELVRDKRTAPGGEYEGRAAEVQHGQANSVGLIDLKAGGSY